MSLHTDNTDFTPPTIEEVSALLPAYEIISFIAKGGMGAVYKATQKSLDRSVAIKILPRHFSEDAEFRASFETEAKSMAKLNHPNLIGIYDFGQVDGLLYIIMEMVEGQSLYHASYEKQIEPADAAEVVFQICMGLDNAHKQGILHRDIKPANILLGESASPKIGDFGLARPVGEHELDTAFGTPGYTAPEVMHNPRAVDESTDLYAVGVMLYELITGKIPDKHYVSITQFVNANPKFDQIIRKAINPIPSQRYSSAKEMADALKSLASKKGAASPFAQPSSSAAVSTQKINPYAASVNKRSGNSFIRNIIVIAILLGAIYFAWEGYKKVQIDRAAKAAKIKEDKKKTEAEKEAKAEKKRQELKEQARIAKLKEKERLALLRKQQTLEYLQPSLLNGSRDKFPNGSIERGEKVRFFIDKKMTWLNAQIFCEEYGGHLAIITDTEEQDWFTKQINSSDPIWLGAGTTGIKQWGWIDGSPFTLKIRKTTTVAYATLDSTGFLNPENVEKKLTFFIEWNKNGTTPATLEKQLKRCAASIKSEKTQFPAGTMSYGDSHYLLVSKNLTWLEAKKQAEEAGGVLASTNTSLKNEVLSLYISRVINTQKGCWIGAHRRSDTSWKWVSGVPWSFTKWAPNEPNVDKNKTAVGYINTKLAWDDLTENETCPFFMIEWNKKKPSNIKTHTAIKTDDLKPLRKICLSQINKIQSAYEKKIKNNTSAYKMEISTHLRSIPPQEKDEALELIDGLIEISLDYYISPLGDTDNQDVPKKIQTILDYRIKKQTGFDTARLSDIDALRIRYHKKINSLIAEYRSKELSSKIPPLEQEIEAINNTETFYNQITGKDLTAPDVSVYKPSSNNNNEEVLKYPKIFAEVSIRKKRQPKGAIFSAMVTAINKDVKIDSPPCKINMIFIGENQKDDSIFMVLSNQEFDVTPTKKGAQLKTEPFETNYDSENKDDGGIEGYKYHKYLLAIHNGKGRMLYIKTNLETVTPETAAQMLEYSAGTTLTKDMEPADE